MQIKRCQICNKEIYRTAKNNLCRQCWKRQIQSKIVPSKQQLINDIKQLNSHEKIAEKYNKSVDSVRRWFRKYNLKIKQKEKKQWYCQTCNEYFNSLNELRKHKSIHPQKCKYCGQIFDSGHELGSHISNCKLNPNYQNIRLKRRESGLISHKHTQQQKRHMSKIRKQYLRLHPQKHPWRRADKFKSKPCQDLKQFLTDNNIHFYPQYSNPQQFSGRFYAIDIAFPNQKIAIQVNGFQHYKKDGSLTDYHQQKHNIIQQAGWKILEVPCIKTYSIQFRQSLLKLINQNIEFTYDYTSMIQERKRKKLQQHICPICGGEKKSKYSKCCVKCSPKIRKK